MRRSLATTVALVAVLGLAGCSSSGSDATAKTSTTTSAPTKQSTTTIEVLEAKDIDVNASPYCADWAQIRAVPYPKTTTRADLPDDARKAFYVKLTPLVEKLLADAPSSLKVTVQKALDQTHEAAKEGNVATFAAPEAQDTSKTLASYALKNCKRK